jgi:hypothetical protein
VTRQTVPAALPRQRRRPCFKPRLKAPDSGGPFGPKIAPRFYAGHFVFIGKATSFPSPSRQRAKALMDSRTARAAFDAPRPFR